MIALYMLMVSALKALNWFVTGQANSFERKYTAAVLEAEKAVQPVLTKPGNAQKADALKVAKAQYEAGRLVLVRDELEQLFLMWQSRRENLGHFIEKFSNWNGRFAFYFLGMIDLALLLVAAHFLGLPHELSQENVRAWLEKLIRRI